MAKVLYIAGWGRSGTTILDNLLGQIPGFHSSGEVHYVWKRGLGERRDCGCGRRLVECDHWARIFEAGFGGFDNVDPDRVVASQEAIKTRNVRQVKRLLREGRMLDGCEYAPYLKGLYDGIIDTTPTSVIVDSSKFPVDALVAAGLPGYDVHVVHLVRDPRAVAHSWSRRKNTRDKASGELRRVGLARSSMVWQAYNEVIRREVGGAISADRYHLLRYEQLVAEPARTLRELADFAGESTNDVPAIENGWVDLAPTHTGSGNPGRFVSGRTQIKLDNAWEREMPRWRRTAATVLSTPMLARMGYGHRHAR